MLLLTVRSVTRTRDTSNITVYIEVSVNALASSVFQHFKTFLCRNTTIRGVYRVSFVR